MLVVANDLAFGLQPVADAARSEIVEREPQRHGAPVQRVEHRRAHRRIEEGRQHAAMDDAEGVGVLRTGQETADGAPASTFSNHGPLAAAKPEASVSSRNPGGTLGEWTQGL